MTWRERIGSRAAHVVVVGDVLLDVDLDGETSRICPDAPAPVVDLADRRESPGGAGLVALLCADSGARVTLVAPLADDDEGRRLTAMLSTRVDLVPLPHEGRTRTKTRVRSGGQTLLRLDDGGPGRPADVPRDVVGAALAGADVVLVSDYGAGTTAHDGMRALLAEGAAAGFLVWDPHPRGAGPVAGATLVTPNLAEARTAAATFGDTAASHPEQLAAVLRERWSALACCVTAGSSGAYLATGDGEPLFVPAQVVSTGDPCGAGDRFVATAATALAGGAVLSEAVVDAVREASAWVATGGAAGYRGAGERTPAGASQDVVARVRAAGGRVVATGGCFDVLHAGHVACLEAARRLGDALVVLLNSDASVRRAKGPGRPVVPAEDRARVLLGLGCVDAVEVFEEDDPSAALERLRPDVWAKGGDYGGTPLPEAEVVRRHGGRVVLLPYLDGRSSSRILARSGAHQEEA